MKILTEEFNLLSNKLQNLCEVEALQFITKELISGVITHHSRLCLRPNYHPVNVYRDEYFNHDDQFFIILKSVFYDWPGKEN